jgi:adenylate cyclase
VSRYRRAALIGTVVALAGLAAAAVPAVATLEDSLGLRWLFAARGTRPSPAGVTIVSIDETVSARLGLPTLPRDWPRGTHAKLIDRLVQHDASAIIFDLQFFRPSSRAEDDELMGAAVSRSSRTVLVQRIETPRVGREQVWEMQNPSAPLTAGAAVLAPAVLPATDVTSWYWLSIKPPAVPPLKTLPVAALDLHAARSNDPAVVRAAARATELGSLAYLNFYGPPGTICTVPYDVVLNDEEHRCAIRGAVVFVGVGKGRIIRADQPDTYVTPFSPGSEGAFSGVEIHATAVANLLDGSAAYRMPAGSFATLLLLGLMVGGVAYLVRTRWRRTRSARVMAAASILCIGVAYALVVFVAFRAAHVLLPSVVPLALQIPVALVIGLVVRPHVVRQQAEAVCLAADAAGSTALGQQMGHEDYASLMRRYHEALLVPIRQHGGEPLPPQGDGFVAVWTIQGASTNPSARRAATAAALALMDAADEFNHGQPADRQLSTRVGLSVGAVTLVGDADRGVVEAFGDAINVAARLRDLNVRLGTSVLATDDVTKGVADAATSSVPAGWALKGLTQQPRVVALRAATPEIPGTGSPQVRHGT